MKTSILFLVCLLVVCSFVDKGESRAAQETEKRGCYKRCWRVCVWVVCYTRCKTYCSKRSLEEPPQVQELPFASKFETYDQDNDGFITPEEFIKTMHMEELSGNATFKLADKNGDGKLDRDEFDAAPFVKGPVDGEV